MKKIYYLHKLFIVISICCCSVIAWGQQPTAGAITGATNVCINETIILSANPSGGSGIYTTYNWTVTNGTGSVSGTSVSNTISLMGITSGNFTVTYTVTDNNGMTSNNSSVHSAVVNSIPIVNPISDSTYCNNDIGQSVVFTGSGTSYTWTNDNTAIGLPASGSGDLPGFIATNNTNSSISATITVTPMANGCTGNSETFDITVNPTPTVHSIGNLVYCNGDNGMPINFTGAVTNTTYSWVSSANVGFGTNGTGNISAFVATNTTTAAITATITVTSMSNNCQGSSTSFDITVNPTPSINAVANITVANQETVSAINFGSTVSGTTYQWTNNNTTIGLASSGTGNISAFQAVNTDSLPVTATITVTPTANNCVGSPITFTITVNPTGTVNGLVNQVVCNGDLTAPTNFVETVPGTTFNWINDEPSIGLAASGTGDIATFSAVNLTSVPITATITVTPEVGGVLGTPEQFTIKVNPTPIVDPVSNIVYCNNDNGQSINFTGNVMGETYAWTCSENIGFGLNGTGNISSFTAINTTDIAKTATIQVTPMANNCTGTPINFTITVNPTPKVDLVNNLTYCNGTVASEIPFTGTVSGTIYNWLSSADIGFGTTGTGNIGSFTATNTTNTTVIATITITPTANGCIGASESFTITVNPIPTVDPVPDKTVCNNEIYSSVAFTSNFNVANTNYNWSNSNPNIGLTASGIGNIPNFQAANTTNSQINGTITVTPVANTCIGVSQAFIINVNPTPTVDPVGNQTICDGAITNAVIFSSTANVAATTYNWTNDSTTINLGASGVGNVPAFVALNGSSSPIASMVTVTPVANNCIGSSETFIITVNPIPTVDPIANKTVCNGLEVAATNFFSTGGVSGITYNWSNDNTTIGLNTSGTGDISSFIGTNTANTPKSATITVTPSANNCVGTSETFEITINPIPTVDTIGEQVICKGETTNTISFGSSFGVLNTTFDWENDNIDIGLGTSGIGNIPSFTATNSSNSAITGNVIVTPTADNCVGIPENFKIIINPTPTVDKPNDIVLCNGEVTTIIDFTTSFGVLGTTYEWTNDKTSIGLGAIGTASIPSFVATNLTNMPVVATITIKPIANNCEGTSQTFTITVNPTPTVDAIGDQTLCSGESINQVTFSSSFNVTGTTYSWTNDNPTIGLGASGNGNISSFTANNTTAGIITGGCVVIPTANGCVGTSETFTITVNPIPTVDPVVSNTICNGDTVLGVNFTSTFGVIGTTYNWTNDNSTIGLAANGTGNIPLFVTNNNSTNPITAGCVVTPTANGCMGNSEAFNLTIKPTPFVDPVVNQTVCSGQPTAAVNFTSIGGVTGTTYTWTNDNTAINLIGSGGGNIPVFNATNTTNSSITANITVTPLADGCVGGSESFTITGKPTPTVNKPVDQIICNNTITTPVDFTSIGGVTGIIYTWTNDNSTIGLTASGTGNISAFTATNSTNNSTVATITVTPIANGCNGLSETFNFTVNPTPTVDDPIDQVYCNGEVTNTINFTSTFGVAGTTYDWTNNTLSIGLSSIGMGAVPSFTATNTTGNSTNAVITVTPTAANCLGTSESYMITVNPTPTVDPIGDQLICDQDITQPIQFTSSFNVSGTLYNWTCNNTSIGLGANGQGDVPSFTGLNTSNVINTATITVTPEAATCLGSNETFIISIKPRPTVNPVMDQTVCNGVVTSPINFTSGNGVAGTDFNWSNNSPNIGLVSSGQGNISSFVASNNSNVPDTALLIVEPVANNCFGDSEDFMIIINPTPTIDAINDLEKCNGEATSPITFNSLFGVSGTTYDWTNSNTAINLQSSGTGDIASFTLANTTNAPINSTLTVTPKANNCFGIAESATIIVNPTPTVDPVSVMDICNNALSPVIVFSSAFGVSGTTYDWMNTDIGIGLLSSGSGDINSFTAINVTDDPVISNVTVTPSANNCVGASTSFDITVNPTPIITDIVFPEKVKAGVAFEIELFTNVIDLTDFTWSSNEINVIGAASGVETDNPLQEVLDLENNNANGLVEYSVFATSLGCMSDLRDFSLQVLVDQNDRISATNTFTPNSDGINDLWKVSYTDISNPDAYRISIYNASGAKIHEMGLNDQWDGGNVPDHSYLYIITGPDNYQKHGTILILRK